MLDNYYLTLFFSLGSPLLLYFALNKKYYLRKQATNSIAFILFLSIFIGYTAYALNIHEIAFSIFALAIFAYANYQNRDFILHKKIYYISIPTLIFILSIYPTTNFSIISHLNSYLILYFIFSLFICFRNARTPASLMHTEPIKYLKNNIKLNLYNKPNIYIIFLESIHSKDGLEMLYNSHDFGLTNFLTDNKFTLYKSYAHRSGTIHAINTILDMSLEKKENEEHKAISILKDNGYTIKLYDIGYHIMRHLACYADVTNINICQRKFENFFLELCHFLDYCQLCAD